MYEKVEFWSGDPENRVLQIQGYDGSTHFYCVEASGNWIYGYPTVHLHKEYRVTLFVPLPGGSPVVILNVEVAPPF